MDHFCKRGEGAEPDVPGWLAFPIAMLRRDFDSFCDGELGKIGLKRGHLHFILYVGRHPGCTQKEIASLLDLDTGHSARYVAWLVGEGFLERVRSERDGRSQALYLTERGAEAFARSREILDEWDASAMEPLSEEERLQLKALLRRVLAGRLGGRPG